MYLLHVFMVLLKSQTDILNQLSGDTDSNLFKSKKQKLNEYGILLTLGNVDRDIGRYSGR